MCPTYSAAVPVRSDMAVNRGNETIMRVMAVFVERARSEGATPVTDAQAARPSRMPVWGDEP